MSRYFFHISGADPFHDLEGMDLPDDQAAWCEAKRLVRDIESNLAPGQDWPLFDSCAIWVHSPASRSLGFLAERAYRPVGLFPPLVCLLSRARTKR
jgi:hypothetical protein